MRKFAKLLSALLVITALLSVLAITVSAEDFEFADVDRENEELYEAVQLLHSLEIAKGQTKTTYGVSKYVTREQMATFIYRLMKEGRSIEYGPNVTPFTDLEDDYYFGMISWASHEGIIKGVTETEFNPYGRITLQDCYVMIARALGYEKDGPLGYPHEYIDIAERLELNKNIDKETEYTAALNRGDVAIILYNAFFAEMNEKTTGYKWETDNTTGKAQYVAYEKPVTLCEKIYDISIIKRRIVATPSFGLDLRRIPEALSNSEFVEYAPTFDERDDAVYIRTAAIIPDEKSKRVEGEESLIEFDKLGLKGKADDYFLKDITIYLKKDGKIVTATTDGVYGQNAKASFEERTGENLKRDYYNSSKSDVTKEKDIRGSVKIKTGTVTIGDAKAYFYNIPSTVKNSAMMIYPEDVGDGRWIYRAGVMWSGVNFYNNDTLTTDDDRDFTYDYGANSYEQNPEGFMNLQRAQHDWLTTIFPLSGSSDYYCDIDYYDCNEDGVVDYFWVQPYTFGKIVDSKVEANSIDKKHTGDSKNRPYYNTSTQFPELYIGDAKVVGGSYTDGQVVFAYVSGPAKYVKIASDDQNNSIRHSVTKPISISDNDYQYDGWDESKWANGLSINAWTSPDYIVGHIGWSEDGVSPSGLISLNDDSYRNVNNKFSGDWRNAVYNNGIDQYWDLYTVGTRVYWAKTVNYVVDIATNYAIIDYINEDDQIVAWDAGYIDYDSTLVEEGLHVRAYIDGKYQFVPIAKMVGEVVQDNDYFIRNSLVNEISTYEIDSKGRYIFKPFAFDTSASDASKLAGKDETASYSTQTTASVSLAKVRDNLYQFVSSGVVPSNLKPNSANYVNIDNTSTIIVKYVNADGYNDFKIYTGGEMPNFNTVDTDMAFTKTYAVFQNNPGSTITEKLAFLYCEIGGDIKEASANKNRFVIVSGKVESVDGDGASITSYYTYDLLTGENIGPRVPYKENEAVSEDFTIYELTDYGEINNTTAGTVASIKSGSADLVEIDKFSKDDQLITLVGGTDVLVDGNTTYVFVDRDTFTITPLEKGDAEEILAMPYDEDVDDTYFNVGANYLTTLILSKDKVDNIDLAYLIIIVRG